jgi:hypothetical protein
VVYANDTFSYAKSTSALWDLVKENNLGYTFSEMYKLVELALITPALTEVAYYFSSLQ